MERLLFLGVVLALLIGLVLVPGLKNNHPQDAVASVADVYVACSAYYQRTADVLVSEGDPDTAEQYRERAALALDAGATLSGARALELSQERNRVVSELSASEEGLGELAARHDERCLALLDE